MKAVVSGLGYRDLVMNLEDAVALIKGMEGAERFTTKYHRAVEGGRDSYTTKHVWSEIDDLSRITLRLMSDDEYRAAKLLGNPEQ